MHFEESMESIADSDLEDGELQKLLTSPLYAQRASGKPDAVVVQESEISAQTSHSSEDPGASGKPAALFSPKCNQQRNQMWSSSVFGNANLPNLRGNKDHLLDQARSDLAQQELHVESANKCIDELRRQTEEQRLALQDAQHGFIESRREQVRLQEELLMKENVLRDTPFPKYARHEKNEESASTTS